VLFVSVESELAMRVTVKLC